MKIANQHMLAAAKQRLSEHLATRPATRVEADAFRRAHQEAAVTLEAEAQSVATKPRIADEIGRGPHAIDAQHGDAILHSQSIRESLRLKRLAADQRLRAAAWNCGGNFMDAEWRVTRSDLQARVTHYQGLVDSK